MLLFIIFLKTYNNAITPYDKFMDFFSVHKSATFSDHSNRNWLEKNGEIKICQYNCVIQYH